MSTVPISVLIPTMNRPKTLQNTLQSIEQGSCIPSQIIIVDQSDYKDCIEECKSLINNSKLKKILTYVLQEEKSLTKARNNAYRYAKEEIIVCCDDDVIVEKHTLENVNEIMKDKSISMIAGVDTNNIYKQSKFGFIQGTRSFIKRNIGHITKSMFGRYPDGIREETMTEWAMGYFFVVRNSIIKKGEIMWDENLKSYAYAEDLDFSYSYYLISKKNKMNCIISPLVKVKHCVSGEYRIPSKMSTKMYVIHRSYLIYKYKKDITWRLAFYWANYMVLIYRFVKRYTPQDLLEAMKLEKKNRKKIKELNLDFLYEARG